MKLALVALALSLAACVDSPTPAPASASTLVERCGRPPQEPPMPAAIPVVGDPSAVTIAPAPWSAHSDWVAAAFSWAKCASDAEVVSACGAVPSIPSWSYTPGTVPNPSDAMHPIPVVVVDAAVWSMHLAWADAMIGWSSCADSTNPS